MMKFKAALYERVLYPVYQLRHGPYGVRIIKVFKYLNQSQWFSEDKIRVDQNNKLKRLIEHVYHNVPYYRNLMQKKGIVPQDINCADDLKYFPVLTKKIIRSNYQDIMSLDLNKRRVMESSTGGTTGEPLKLYLDKDTRIWREAARLRGWSWANFQIGMSVVAFPSNNWPSLIGKLRIGMINEHAFPFFLEENDIVGCFPKVKDIKPHCITGISSYLCRIASVYSRNHLNEMHVPVIITTSEVLYDHNRGLLENTFKGKVYDQYGCVEIGSLAYECEHNNKHISDEHVIVEAVNSEGSHVVNAPGHLIITDLDNYAMPFIRYKIGDVGTLSGSRCKCGRGLSVLKSMDGREDEFLKKLEGGFVPPIYFPARFARLKGIKQYQIVQTDVEHIVLIIVKNAGFSSETIDEMINVIKEKLGHIVNVTIEERDNIPLTSRGKTRLVISHVPVQF